MNLARKHAALIVAVIGVLAIIFGPDYLGLVEDQKAFAELALGVLTALGVGVGEHVTYDKESDEL